VLGDGQPQACAPGLARAGLIYPVEALENTAEMLEGDTRAKILHGKLDIVFHLPRAHQNTPAALSVFHRVLNEIAEYLRQRVFIGQHGSWNRNPRAGYKVIFVPFANGMPSGQPRDILTGFVNGDGEAQGRPVGVAIDTHGALLVADDVGNTVWRVTPAKR